MRSSWSGNKSMSLQKGLVATCLLLSAALFASAQPAPTRSRPAEGAKAQPREVVLGADLTARMVEPRAREICLVCNEPVHLGDLVYLISGQRVPVHLVPCNEKFLANPRSFLALITPRGAFLDASAGRGKLSGGWFLVGLYVLVGLLFAALSAHRAFERGRSASVWFGVGLLLNLFGYLLLLALPKRPVQLPAGVPAGLRKIAGTYPPQPCRCGAMNHPSATRCSACGAELTPVVVSEVLRVGLRTS